MPSTFYPAYALGQLHPDSERVLSWLAAGDFPPLCDMSPADARKAFLLPQWLGEARPGVSCRHAQAGTVPVRVYTPRGNGPWPILVYFHGGGFVLGCLDEFEPFATFLAEDAHCIVVSVDYRLAPEAPFPAALDDAWTGTLWAAAQAASFGGDPARIAVAGDSAGANLAAGVALLARDQGGPRLCHQALICPWLDLSPGAGRTDSYRWFGPGLWLSATALGWYCGHYLTDPDLAGTPRVSPLAAATLAGLPPAQIILAEFDPLADQGRAYASALRAAGVPAAQTCHPGMLHDFVTLPGLFPSAWGAIDSLTAALAAAFQQG
jgi:acetyl esterase